MSIDMRYKDLVSNMNEFTFHILGCGAIGSSAAVQLARLGATYFCLYDDDIVEEPNIGVSQYYIQDLGKKKVDALNSHLIDIIGHDLNICTFCERFGEYYYQDHKDIVILGFDSMKSRLEAVEILCKNKKFKPQAIIDGRMGAEHYQQYFLAKPTVKSYIKTWYSDEEGDPEPCSAKATSYCSNMAGAFIANTVRKMITDQPTEKEIMFNFPVMMLSTK